MLSAEASSAICVGILDGSRNPAIHTTYRSLLRPSSLREPRYPLLRVVSKLVRSSRRSEIDPHRFRRRHVPHHANGRCIKLEWVVKKRVDWKRYLRRFGCSRRNNNTHPKNATNKKVFLRASILPPLRERGREALEENQRVRRLPRYLLPEERETRKTENGLALVEDRRRSTKWNEREEQEGAFPRGSVPLPAT